MANEHTALLNSKYSRVDLREAGSDYGCNATIATNLRQSNKFGGSKIRMIGLMHVVIAVKCG
jgi:hypothetical protein